MPIVRYIMCECGNGTEMPADEQRHHSGDFEWISNTDDGEAWYRCPFCKQATISKCEEKEKEE
jgi:hypothetical protein